MPGPFEVLIVVVVLGAFAAVVVGLSRSGRQR